MAVEFPTPWENVTTLTRPEGITPPPSPLNILVIGSGPFASDTLRELKDDGNNIKGVVTPRDKDGKKDPLRTTAAEMEIAEIHNLGELRNEGFAGVIENMGVDLIVGANLTATILPHIYNSAPAGMIAFHPSFLPEYKGASAINWQIIDGGEKYGNPDYDVDLIGLTAYRIEDDGNPEKLDSGRIIGQVVIEDPNQHTSASIYREVLSDFGVRLMRDSVRVVANEYANGQIYHGEEQADEGSYQPPLKASDASIDWGQDATKIHNLIRGSQNSPGARTKFTSVPQQIILFDASRIEGPTRNPGKVTIDDEGMLVEAGQGLIFIKTMQEDGTYDNGSRKPRVNPFAYTYQNGNDLSQFEVKSLK